MKSKKKRPLARRTKMLSRSQLEEQRINFAFGNAPEGASKWVTRRSLRKAAANRVFFGRSDLHQ
jgi:hypothetical protein